MWQDCRLAVRALRATPLVSAVAVLSLALGIGANSAIFSLVNAVLLRPLPVKDPHALVLVSEPNGVPSYSWSYPVWDQIRQRPQLFDGTLAFFATRYNLSSVGEAEIVDAYCVSGSFFRVLGVDAYRGRTLNDDDDQRGGKPGEGPAAVISHGFWQRRFGSAADVVGRTITVERTPFTIVGILPPGFSGVVAGRGADVMITVANVPQPQMLKSPGLSWLAIMGRLRPDQTVASASAAVRAEQAQIRAGAMLPTAPGRPGSARMKSPLTLEPAGTGNPFGPMRRRFERPLLATQIVVGLVLLIACANIGNLMLARGDARRHEMSTRIALGASRGRLVRQCLTEATVLAVLGAAVGLVFARWAGPVLVGFGAADANPLTLDVALDGKVLGFTAAVAMLAALLFGTVPALRASRVDPIAVLNEQGRGGVAARTRAAHGVVVVQVALSLILLMGAGLFVRTFHGLATMNLGFQPDGVMVVNLDSPPRPGARPTPYDDVRKAVLSLPEVTAGGLAAITPVTGTAWDMPVAVEGAPPLAAEQSHVAGNAVSPGWFGVYRTRLLAGRDFTDGDVGGSRPVTIVNQAFARRFLNGENPVGRIVRQAGQPPPGAKPLSWEIVGMVEDTTYESLREERPAMLYAPFAQFSANVPLPEASLSVRSDRATPAALKQSVAAAITAVDSGLILTFRSLPSIIDVSLRQERTLAMLVGFFGLLALLLSALGIYGVTAYSVARRRSEIGVRLALGATPGSIVNLILSKLSMLIGVGIVVGAGVTLWLSRFVTPLLFGIDANDVMSLAAASVTMAIIGILSGWLPARRAARSAPLASLREQ